MTSENILKPYRSKRNELGDVGNGYWIINDYSKQDLALYSLEFLKDLKLISNN